MAHQFEEYIYPGGFREWMHAQLFGDSEQQTAFSKRAAFIINVPVGWSVFGAAAWIGSDLLWFSLPVMAILFVNAWFHIALSLAHNTYVPGTNTSILLHLPLATYAFYYVSVTWQTEFTQLMTSIMIALLLHMGFLLAARSRGKTSDDDSLNQTTE